MICRYLSFSGIQSSPSPYSISPSSVPFIPSPDIPFSPFPAPRNFPFSLHPCPNQSCINTHPPTSKCPTPRPFILHDYPVPLFHSSHLSHIRIHFSPLIPKQAASPFYPPLPVSIFPLAPFPPLSSPRPPFDSM